jgi:hypothetical protein
MAVKENNHANSHFVKLDLACDRLGMEVLTGSRLFGLAI